MGDIRKVMISLAKTENGINNKNNNKHFFISITIHYELLGANVPLLHVPDTLLNSG